jgi:hypothetical protein
MDVGGNIKSNKIIEKRAWIAANGGSIGKSTNSSGGGGA